MTDLTEYEKKLLMMIGKRGCYADELPNGGDDPALISLWDRGFVAGEEANHADFVYLTKSGLKTFVEG